MIKFFKKIWNYIMWYPEVIDVPAPTITTKPKKPGRKKKSAKRISK